MKNINKGKQMKTTKKMALGVVLVVTLSTVVHATCASDIDMGGNTISNVADPVANTDVVNKRFLYDTLKKGHIRDDAKEVVTSIRTGLMWQDDIAAETVEKPWLTPLNYYKCTHDQTDFCTDTAGDTAATYCENLSLGGYSDWKLPTKDELVGISKSSVFTHVASNYYWSSTTNANYSSYAWGVHFSNGNQGYYYKYYSYYVRCVRAGQ